jgi:osmoprotectant transport system ATP-binding protein
VLALPPILLNAYVGLRDVDADAVEAAIGMGMNRGQVLRKIRIPLAAPAMFAGARTAAVQVLAGATLAPFIGGGGLGDFIATGIGMMDMSRLIVGAVPIAILALATEFILGRAEKHLFAESAAPSVDHLTLDVPEGSTVALIGPSGCGKTTTMRMINRLIEPTEGRIFVNGENVTKADPVKLRRHIGYVIQNVGLFPHMTIAENIAAVPNLLSWDRPRIARRTDELLDLVGLDPKEMLKRYPRQLSGGQRQRIGVARALAADPSVLLMDEPFGAIDPIARTRLQDEFRQILKRVRKTVVLVTHDLDEAIRLGDRIAIMRAGKIVQYDAPDAILSHPADDFVANFVGIDRAIKRLSLFSVADAMRPGVPSSPAASVAASANLRDALSLMVAANSDVLSVVDGGGIVTGQLTRDAIFSI